MRKNRQVRIDRLKILAWITGTSAVVPCRSVPSSLRSGRIAVSNRIPGVSTPRVRNFSDLRGAVIGVSYDQQPFQVLDRLKLSGSRPYPVTASSELSASASTSILARAFFSVFIDARDRYIAQRNFPVGQLPQIFYPVVESRQRNTTGNPAVAIFRGSSYRGASSCRRRRSGSVPRAWARWSRFGMRILLPLYETLSFFPDQARDLDGLAQDVDPDLRCACRRLQARRD